MKKNLCMLLSILLFATSFAKTITVSNNPTSPGQYKDLQTAIDAAKAGDILLVSGSSIDYGQVTINKRLTIYGQGYDPRKDVAFPTSISSILLNNNLVNDTASGSAIYGCTVSSFYVAFNGDPSTYVNNITVKRNTISYISADGSGWVISDNIITSQINVDGANCLIKNNVFTGSYIYNDNLHPNLIITNNNFTSTVNLQVSNAIVSNNIFYYKSSSVVNFAYGGNAINTVFNNNIYYNNSNTNPFNIGQTNNTGTGNINNKNPKYISYDLTTTEVTRNDNLQLQTSSPAKNAGTDGKDIGGYGGATPMKYPLSGEPAIPQVKTMNINNTTVSPGSILQVQVKANSNN
ncbi:MAG: hypothetical protein ABJB05_09520 [Parafilimonas sp.]